MQLSGKVACQTLIEGSVKKNECHPYKIEEAVLQTHNAILWLGYTCVCHEPYSQDSTKAYPNCLGINNMCGGLLCQHGQCISAGSFNKFTCVCKAGWRGKSCNLPQPIITLLEWSEWTSCIRTCGEQRLRSRSRKCMGSRKACYRNTFQIRGCRSRACFRFYTFDQMQNWARVRASVC